MIRKKLFFIAVPLAIAIISAAGAFLSMSQEKCDLSIFALDNIEILTQGDVYLRPRYGKTVTA